MDLKKNKISLSRGEFIVRLVRTSTQTYKCMFVDFGAVCPARWNEMHSSAHS